MTHRAILVPLALLSTAVITGCGTSSSASSAPKIGASSGTAAGATAAAAKPTASNDEAEFALRYRARDVHIYSFSERYTVRRLVTYTDPSGQHCSGEILGDSAEGAPIALVSAPACGAVGF